MASSVDGKIIFVRDQATFRFLNRDGSWVASFEDAAKFASTWEAFDFCRRKAVRGVEAGIAWLAGAQSRRNSSAAGLRRGGHTRE